MFFVSWLSKISFFQTSISLFCPGIPCYAKDFGDFVVCSEITDCGKSEQNPASCYYLLVVKLVVKRNFLLLRIFTTYLVTH